MADAPTDAATAPPSLWDPVVRLSHWGIAAAVVLNALVNEGGSLAHVSIGWGAMALLLMRLIWGVLGPSEARFSAFPPNPLTAFAHLRGMASGERPRDYPSHNPAGALMVYAFWAALTVVIATGLVMTGGATPMQVAADKAAVASGDWSALVKGDGEDHDEDSAFKEGAEDMHEIAANLLLILAALHIAGVFVEGRLMRRDLLAPMLLGSKTKAKAKRRQ
ncbi:MAG: cytochrome B [Rhodobacterales bacterium]|nr:MAG: cytochrome B [Rhodobacterales bacterium]